MATIPYPPTSGNEDSAIRNAIITRIIRKGEIPTKAFLLAARFYPGRKALHEDIWQDFIEQKFCRMTPKQLEAFEKRKIGFFAQKYRWFLIDKKRGDGRIPQIDPIIPEGEGGIQIPSPTEMPSEKINEIIRAIRKSIGEIEAIIIQMTYHGYSSKDIAKRIRSTDNAVNMRRKRIRENPIYIQIINQIL